MTTPRKRFAHTSNTWQLFQKYFFLDSSRYPYTLGPMPRGNAINLVQGLNCCNVQWADEQSMPHIFLTLSAKAKKGEGENALWEVEISTNYRKQGIASPSKASRKSTDWMAKLLAKAPDGNGPASSPPGEAHAAGYVPSGTEASGTEAPEPQGENTPPAEPAISHMESAVENWLFTAAGGNTFAPGANAADTSAPRADAPEQEGENPFVAPHRPSPPSMEELGCWIAGARGEEK